MKIYTRTGDRGETGLFGGARVSKTSARVAAYGAVDELNAALGVVLSALPGTAHPRFDERSGERLDGRLDQRPDDRLDGRLDERLDELQAVLRSVQATLFQLGAELACASGERAGEIAPVGADAVTHLEHVIDRLEATLEPLRHFILPGGTPAAAALHLARTVCRRAERATVLVAEHETVRPEVLAYLNRLSDLLFVAARAVNAAEGTAEIVWRGAG